MEKPFFNILKFPIDFALGIFLIGSIILFDLVILLKFSQAVYFKAFLILSLIPLFFLIIYTFVIPKKNIENTTKKLTYSLSMILKIFYFALISVAILSIYIINSDFIRSVYFFILISSAIFVLLIELMYFEIKGKVSTLLFQICLISILIRIIPLTFIPGFYMDDPYFHEWFSVSIINNFIIPIDTQYSPFPIMHLLLAMTQIITNSTFKIIGMITLPVFQAIIMPLLIFLICRKIFNNLQISLIAALIFGFSDLAIGESLQGPWPTTYAIFLISLITLIIMQFLFKKDIRYISLIFLLSFILTLSHSFSALIFIFLIIFFSFSLLIGKKINDEEYSNFTYPTILISISVILYWLYTSNFIFDSLVMIVSAKESGIKASFSTAGGIAYAQLIPLKEYLLELSGKFIYFGLALIGLLFVLRKPKESLIRLVLIIFGLFLFFIGGFALIFALGIAPDRIMYYSYIFLPIPAAIGIVLFSKNMGKFNIIMLIIVFLFIFLMLTNSSSDKDSPIYSIDFTSKRYLDSAERESVDTIVNYSKNIIVTDNDLGTFIKRMKGYDSVIVNFYSPNFEKYAGSVIITRSSFTKYPMYSRGLYRLNYDPDIKIEDSGFNHIYNSNVLNAYI